MKYKVLFEITYRIGFSKVWFNNNVIKDRLTVTDVVMLLEPR